MDTALSIALIVLGAALTFLVVLQGRNAGLQSRDASSIYQTKRGLEKTMFQATIILGVLFLILAFVVSANRPFDKIILDLRFSFPI